MLDFAKLCPDEILLELDDPDAKAELERRMYAWDDIQKALCAPKCTFKGITGKLLGVRRKENGFMLHILDESCLDQKVFVQIRS